MNYDDIEKIVEDVGDKSLFLVLKFKRIIDDNSTAIIVKFVAEEMEELEVHEVFQHCYFGILREKLLNAAEVEVQQTDMFICFGKRSFRNTKP